MNELTDDEKKRLRFILNKIQNEIYEAMYHKPKCDFEHIYNQGLASADDILMSWMPPSDEVLELNMDKLNEIVFIPNKSKTKKKCKVEKEGVK